MSSGLSQKSKEDSTTLRRAKSSNEIFCRDKILGTLYLIIGIVFKIGNMCACPIPSEAKHNEIMDN